MGYLDVPEVILGYRSFELPIYGGPNIDLTYLGIQRFTSESNSRDDDIIKDISRFKTHALASNFDHHLGKLLPRRYDKIVYCCMGTYTDKYRKSVLKFLDQLVQLFYSKQNWMLIYSAAGSQARFSSLNQNQYPNIKIYDFTPQQQLLPYCDLVITHGGLNTIIECVFAEVPLLILPFAKQADHRGNASRASYYGIGKVINQNKKITLKRLEAWMTEAMNNPDYKQSLHNLKKSCNAEEEVGIEKLRKVLKKKINSIN